MRPADLLSAQHDFVVRAEGMPRFREVMADSLRSPYTANKVDVPPVFQGDRFVDRLAIWGKGMAIEVTEHMTDLVTWVAAEMQPTDAVDLDLAPSPYGFAHFEKPLKVRDVRGEDLLVSWLIWGPIQVDGGDGPERGIGCLQLTDKQHPDSSATRYLRDMQRDFPEWLEAMGRWIYTGFRVLTHDERVGPPYNAPLATVQNFDPEWKGELTGSTNALRLIYALWTVMNQPITDVREEAVDRATKRRMERMKIPPKVTVITLRRPVNPHRPDEEGHIEWQHHWIVRGHPRWQPYGPGRQERKLIWINPHVKGNLDAPLHQSEKVYRVAR